MAGDLKEVGVEAIVKGLSAFQGDMRSINSALQGVRGEGTLLQRAFGAIGEGIRAFGAHVVRVAEVALGVLLRDAIRAIIDSVRELISATIDSGSEFQTLELRLKRLNFNDLIESGKEYSEASKEAIDLTKEQLKWLVLLAAQSPYDATDVARTFSLARSYGFTGDEARGLTEDILDFSSGMGLSALQMERIIVNFGQMQQQGKVTGREMTDLARGAFVPVNAVLDLMKEKTGLAGDEFDDFKNSTEGVNAFMNAFSELVETKFAGATEEMAQTFKASTENVMDLVKGIFGLNAVKPVLDAVGKRVSEFANAFTDDPEKWDRLTSAAAGLGEALAGIVGGIFDLLPSTEDLAEGVISTVEGITTWVENNQENIIAFFKGIGDTIKDDLIPFVQDQLIPAFEKISGWVDDNSETINAFFSTLGEIVSEFFSDLFGGTEGQEAGTGFLDSITKIMEFVIENKDEITKWVEVLWSLFAVWQVISTVLSIVGAIIISVVGFVLSLAAAWSGIIGVISVVGTIFGWIGAAIGILLSTAILPLIFAVIGLALIWKEKGDEIKEIWEQLKVVAVFKFKEIANTAQATLLLIGNWFKNKWEEIKNFTKTTWGDIVDIFKGITGLIKNALMIDWGSVGRNIVQGIANGISSFAGLIADAARNAARAAWQAARDFLQSDSPSKLFFEIGAGTMEGMALGIQKAAGLAVGTMQGAMAQVSSAAVPSVTNSTVVNNSNAFNLTVNSQSASEPIVQDFNMMQSLAGG